MENIAKNRKIIECNICDYNTSNKYDFEKHCKTKNTEWRFCQWILTICQ